MEAEGKGKTRKKSGEQPRGVGPAGRIVIHLNDTERE